MCVWEHNRQWKNKLNKGYVIELKRNPKETQIVQLKLNELVEEYEQVRRSVLGWRTDHVLPCDLMTRALAFAE